VQSWWPDRDWIQTLKREVDYQLSLNSFNPAG
jgi:hypothetical protein